MTAAQFTNRSSHNSPDQRLVAGRYRLQERIGRGRLGEIYLALDEGDGSPGFKHAVAVQLLPDIVVRNPRLFNKLNVGFEWLRAAAHPNIVRYSSIDRDDEQAYLVMELLEGLSLDELLDDTGPLPLNEVLPVLRDVAGALQLLHGNGLVHGKLTAGNVFVTGAIDARLLDVVPLDSPGSIFGGAANAGDSSGANDVVALARLAYQMLAGRQAGAEPGKIIALGDRQWEALCRVLAPGDEHAPISVADFMRDFDREDVVPLPAPTLAEMSMPKSVSSAPIATDFDPVVDAVPQSLSVDSWPDEEPDDIRRSPIRAVLLATLLAALGAFYYYGQPSERAVELIAYADENLGLELVEPEQAYVPLSSNQVAAVDATETLQEDIATPASEVELPVAAAAEVGPPAPGDGSPASEAGLPTPEPAISETVAEREEVGPPEPQTAEVVEEPTEVISTEGVVSVSERSGVAKVWLRRNGESKLPLVWWTSDSTARADTDYIAVPEQLVNLAPDEMLHVPLVNDDTPEQRESFFVDFGLLHTEGQIERIASVRIDIDDDDLQ